jgi:ribosomal protein L7Ae-like RNA K-turn-binding protein
MKKTYTNNFYQSKKKVVVNNFIPNRNRLKYANLIGGVVKGFRETVKAIESGKAKLVFLAKDCENIEYYNLIKDLKTIVSFELQEIDTWIELRDILNLGIPSDILIEKKKKIGKEPKIRPKCHCAAIIFENEEEGNIKIDK